MAWLCIDVGTSIVKAVMYGDDGAELAVARQESRILRPSPGFAEQDMESVWTSVVSTVRSLLQQQIHNKVDAIAITAQGDGVWLVDANGHPVGNAILWNDARSGQIVDRWTREGVVEEGFRISGSVTYAGLPNAIWHWLDDHEPGRLANARRSLTCNGWGFYKLTGAFAADLSDASNPFSDVLAEEYSEKLMELYGLQAWRNLLPAIHKGEACVGSLSATAAEALSLQENIPIVMAPYDIVSMAIGCGCVQPDQACVILGTTICAEGITDCLDLTVAPAGTTIALGSGNAMRAMPTLTGCEALTWTADMLDLDGIKDLEQLAAESEPGADGLFFLPYLSLAGERSPFLDPRARGSFCGLSLAHRRCHIARAVLEGLAFVIRDCLQAAIGKPPSEIRVCGGGARSDVWCQIIADVTGASIVRTSDSEVGAKGAFLFGLAATGRTPSLLAATKEYARAEIVFRPDAPTHDFYKKEFDVFLQLRIFAVPQWQVHAALPQGAPEKGLG